MSKYKVLFTLPLDFLSTLKTEGENVEFSFYEGIKFFYYPEKINTFIKNKKCICCGTEANEVRIESGTGTHHLFSNPHINVYGISPNTNYGTFVEQMTVDHSILKSLGGKNLSSNYNTMCKKCNQIRGNRFPVLEDFLKIYKPKSASLINSRAQSIYQSKLNKVSIKEREKYKKERNDNYLNLKEKFMLSLHTFHINAYNKHLRQLKKEKAS